MTAKKPWAVNLNIFSVHQPLYLFLLIYRWASLLLAMWLFLFTTDVFVPGIPLSVLLAISLVSTLVITVVHIPFQLKLFENPVFLAIDILLAIVLLTFSGAYRSPFTFYALSPLLTGALFFHAWGAFLTVTAFSLTYPLILYLAKYSFPSMEANLGQLLTQLVQAWLVVFLFGSLSTVLNQLRNTNKSLTNAHLDLTRQNEELAATYHQLEVIHELTLFLHAPNRESVQQQLLKAVTKEFEFPRAVVGLVNPAWNRVENWQTYPSFGSASALPPPLFLSLSNGPIATAAVKQQVTWVSDQETLVSDKILKTWFGSNNWLILPMIWKEQSVGVLMMTVDEVGQVDIEDERWPILTSLVSQAAVALGNIDHARRFAVEQERNRIARDIHDTVAQSLFGIVFTLDACTKLLPKHADMVKEELIELRNVADKVRQQVRQSVMDLWPTELTKEQFKLDLEKYVKHCCPAHIFHVDYNIDGDFDTLSPALRRGLYRVCQEALSNAAKHSGTDSARVYVYIDQNEVNLSIRDKGTGFDTKPALLRERDREHFGLKGMKERIEFLGGTCDILSQLGYGTQVFVRIPLNSNGHK